MIPKKNQIFLRYKICHEFEYPLDVRNGDMAKALKSRRTQMSNVNVSKQLWTELTFFAVNSGFWGIC